MPIDMVYIMTHLPQRGYEVESPQGYQFKIPRRCLEAKIPTED